MRTKHLMAYLAFGLCVVLSFSAFAAETIRFGVCLSLTGSMRESGNAHLAGVLIRLAEYNDSIGPDGKILEVLVRDDESNAERAAAIVEELATKHGVSAIIGPTSSGLAAAMRPNAVKHEVVVISPTATHPDIGKNDDWVLRILFDDAFQGAGLARFMREDLGIRRGAALVNEKSAYGMKVLDAFHEEFAAKGGVMAAEEKYQLDLAGQSEMDFKKYLQNVADSKPEIILLPNYSWEVSAIIRQSLSIPYRAIFCGGDTWLNENVLLESGNNLEGGYFIAGRNIDSEAPEMLHFRKLYDMSNDPDARPNSFLGYDALSMLIGAMANGTSGKEIREGLFALTDFPLASGNISVFRERGVLKAAYIYKIVSTFDGFAAEPVKEVNP